MSSSSNITIVATTCPRPSHPSARILDETINSARAVLPDSPIVISCDGARPELDREALVRYHAFCESLQGRYDNARVFTFPERGHQTGNMAAILPEIKTPLLFFCEDDWEILPNIQWDELSELILAGQYNYIKIHAYPRINPWHEHMTRARVHHEFGDKNVFLIQTVQFSANPHLASTEWYKEMSEKYRFANRLDFVEEAFHGPMGCEDWSVNKLAIYNPDHGDLARCRHLDGKGNV